MSDIFVILQQKYLKLGICFKADKSEIVFFFYWKGEPPFAIVLGDATVRAIDHLVYLGLPIGSSLRHIRSLILDHLVQRISASYVWIFAV